MVVIAYEVTEQVLAKRKLEENEKHLQNIFSNAPTLICTLSEPQHIFEIANERYLQFIGNRDIIGKPVQQVIPEIVGQGYIELLDEVYATGKPFTGNEMPAKIN